MAIEFEISDTQTFMPIDRDAIGDLVTRTLQRESREDARIEIVFVDNAAIHAINRSALGHDWSTDVITFPLSEPGDAVLAGELVISVEMARSEAGERDMDPHAELALYVIHGLLHLCGLDDITAEAVEVMRAREAYHLAAEKLGIG